MWATLIIKFNLDIRFLNCIAGEDSEPLERKLESLSRGPESLYFFIPV